MKIGIVGLGVVGTANKKGFESLDHEVRCHDTKFDTTIKEVENTDITFICVPTPEGESGWSDKTKIFFFVIYTSWTMFSFVKLATVTAGAR